MMQLFFVRTDYWSCQCISSLPVISVLFCYMALEQFVSKSVSHILVYINFLQYETDGHYNTYLFFIGSGNGN